MAGDLKIADWEYLHAEQIIEVYLEHLRDACNQFALTLEKVRGYALEDGEDGIVTALEEKAAAVKTIGGQAEDLITDIHGRADAFIARIDELDNFVYGED